MVDCHFDSRVFDGGGRLQKHFQLLKYSYVDKHVMFYYSLSFIESKFYFIYYLHSILLFYLNPFKLYSVICSAYVVIVIKR